MKPTLLTLLLISLSIFHASAGPNIQAIPSTLNSFNYTTSSGPSASQTVVLQSGIMATSTGTVTVTGTSHYELSLNNATFSNTVSIPYSGDTLAPTNLYVRMKSGLAAGNYSSESIGITATGINTSVTASGLVTAACTVTVSTVTSTTASFTWNATGASGYECIVDQSASAPTAAGTAASSTSYTQSSLNPNKAYYFHVRGAGAGSNYTSWTTKAFSTKATGVEPASAASLSLVIAPNPNSGAFVVSGRIGAASGEVRLLVVNAAGQLAYAKNIPVKSGDFREALELGFLPAGAYFASVRPADAGSNVECSTVRFSITH